MRRELTQVKKTDITYATKPPRKTRAKIRVDELLTERGLALPLVHAKIMAGQVYVDQQKVASPALLVAPSADVRVRAGKRYVSRAGKKLATACKALRLNVRGKHVLDVGASTGGFSDYCLQHGAAKITAVDVGTAQLAWSLRQDLRVQSFEKTDIRSLPAAAFLGIDLVLADVSFISLTSILPAVFAHLQHAAYLVLIKPQFEIPRKLVPRGGIVSNAKHHRYACERVQDSFRKQGFKYLRLTSSQVLGTKGNQEFFLYAR
ncbi:MAG: TlyA family RNA methyltransferase [Pseudomonadota bacterium]|nr:TlyA family RNA methyltransferase [Pseudomonadota bacterium]